MNKSDIIQILKNDAEYYNGIGRNYLSSSDVGILLDNPAAFGKPRGDGKHFHEGKLFHQLLIEPEKAAVTPFVEASTRNTKIYKDYCEANNVAFCLLKSEVDEMNALASKIKANIMFHDAIYKDGNTYEVPEFGEIHGMMWKGKADIVTDEYVIDLKTTSDIQKFKWSARSYNYDVQAFVYQSLFNRPMVFFVVDKETGQLGVFKTTEDFISRGEQKVKRAVEIWQKYFGPDATDIVDNFFIEDTLD